MQLESACDPAGPPLRQSPGQELTLEQHRLGLRWPGAGIPHKWAHAGLMHVIRGVDSRLRLGVCDAL